MANTKKMSATTKATKTVTDAADVVDVTIEEKKEIVKEVKEKNVSKEKVFKPSDSIMCKSITTGELLMIGIKTGILYRWAERDDESEVEYQDLIAAIRTKNVNVFKPLFIIEDKDFIAQNKVLENLYESMFSVGDLESVFDLDVSDMVATINSLPDGAKESIKNIAATMINECRLDSIQKIKALDELFDTKLMILTDLYN